MPMRRVFSDCRKKMNLRYNSVNPRLPQTIGTAFTETNRGHVFDANYSTLEPATLQGVRRLDNAKYRALTGVLRRSYLWPTAT